MKNHNRSRRWVIGLGGLTLVTGLLVYLRRRTDKVTLQRHFWDVIYDRLATLYDSVDWFTGGMTHRLRQPALRYLPPEGSRLLEIGFGSGRLHVELAERYSMAGLDRAPGMVRLTERRLAARGLTSELQVGDATALPWAEATFDAVLSTFAFSAFPDPDAALAEMVRVVKPGGVIIIVDAGEAQDGNAMAHFLAQLWAAFGDYMRDEVPLMEAQGLTVTREDYGPWGCVHVTVGKKPR
ncbi:MAG: methyltransferase domain-containing protein [Anaerolineae bacterium]|nr:methyltransferase domain-containing protein [Anaerolineae bacterium]